ncbi:alpha/beta hydrolase [Pedobacter sp. G11]|uniref:alpha/beta hydrolase n=1 Tax=Pedobacter sp. G11 TaxID=2482728 RepID=UPI000F5DDF41|nr:alpha/beta fold hydrolase [Pedobacter sp. G11]AZI24270.1 alpha/beta hydrolase [Pedobacter sp. G11]
MKKRYKVLIGISALLVVSYLLGPKPKKPLYNAELVKVPDLQDLDGYVQNIESLNKIKPENEAEIIWADPILKQQTEYAVVYLHGFSASKTEGNPVHLNLAKALHANLYLARLADHGVDTIAPMQFFTADRLWESSKLAYAIGQKLGKKVILVGTSTGGTAALKLAATYPEINSLILLSPNVAINDKNAWLLNDPWGLQIARSVLGSDERKVDGRTAEYKKYWYTNYRIESLVELQEFVESTMQKSVFEKVKQPVLMLYYYKNELEQDPVVRVDAMLKMFGELGTPEDLKRKIAIPNAGNHVLGSYITSKDLPSVATAIDNFVDNVLKVPVL